MNLYDTLQKQPFPSMGVRAVLIFLLATLLVNCDGTNNTSSLEPLPYPGEQPQQTVPTYYLDADSMVALQPELSLLVRGIDPYTMDVDLYINFENQSNQEYNITADRITIYSYNSEPSVATVGLIPAGSTTSDYTVEPHVTASLEYSNDPIDGEIVYYPQEVEFFGVFALNINGADKIFTTQITQPR